MCEKIIGKLPSMTAEDRLQLRRNCERATARSTDGLVVQEALRVLRELQALEHRETSFLARLPAARQIEYAFRRLPASAGERDAIRMLHEETGAVAVGRAGDARCEQAEPAWQRPIREMCRQRRHLLQVCETRRPDPAVVPADDWAAPLLESDSDRHTLRLRPEAEAAFASLGYVAPRSRSAAAE